MPGTWKIDKGLTAPQSCFVSLQILEGGVPVKRCHPGGTFDRDDTWIIALGAELSKKRMSYV